MIVFGSFGFVATMMVIWFLYQLYLNHHNHSNHSTYYYHPVVVAQREQQETEAAQKRTRFYIGVLVTLAICGLCLASLILSSVGIQKYQQHKLQKEAYAAYLEYERTNIVESIEYPVEHTTPPVEKLIEKPKDDYTYPMPADQQEFAFNSGRITMQQPDGFGNVIILGNEFGCIVNGQKVKSSFNQVVRNYLSIGWEGTYFPLEAMSKSTTSVNDTYSKPVIDIGVTDVWVDGDDLMVEIGVVGTSGIY